PAWPRGEAGVRWLEVVEAAAGHGLAGLAGSSPDVGVVGYTLGGGLSFLGRKYGLAASHVQAIEVVTADGQLVRADRQREYDLFWALRGGGSFGMSPRSSSGFPQPRRCTPGPCGTRPSAAGRCCPPGASPPRATPRRS